MALVEKLGTVLSTKGQVILPKAIRDQRQWTAGTRLVVEDTAEGVLLKAAPTFPTTQPKDVYGSLPYRGKAKTLAEMEAGIVTEIKKRHAGDRY